MISVKPGSSFPPGQRSRCLYKCRIFWIPYGRKGWTLPCLRRCRNTAPPIRCREALRPRIPSPAFTYYGKEVWEQALAAILCGENLLLAGGKATGKNVLAENLAAAFGRPAWDISFM